MNRSRKQLYLREKMGWMETVGIMIGKKSGFLCKISGKKEKVIDSLRIARYNESILSLRCK